MRPNALLLGKPSLMPIPGQSSEGRLWGAVSHLPGSQSQVYQQIPAAGLLSVTFLCHGEMGALRNVSRFFQELFCLWSREATLRARLKVALHPLVWWEASSSGDVCSTLLSLLNGVTLALALKVDIGRSLFILNSVWNTEYKRGEPKVIKMFVIK